MSTPALSELFDGSGIPRYGLLPLPAVRHPGPLLLVVLDGVSQRLGDVVCRLGHLVTLWQRYSNKTDVQSSLPSRVNSLGSVGPVDVTAVSASTYSSEVNKYGTWLPRM